MKFYEAIKEIDSTLDLIDYEDMPNKIYEVFNKLRETYAPPIEMTTLQKAQMLAFKEIQAGFSTFMFKQGAGEVPAFEDFITPDREAELMYAWLHPETITIID